MSQLKLPASFVAKYRVGELIGRGATSVDLRALGGAPRILEVRLTDLPGMDGYREYAMLPRIGLVFKKRAR